MQATATTDHVGERHFVGLSTSRERLGKLIARDRVFESAFVEVGSNRFGGSAVAYKHLAVAAAVLGARRFRELGERFRAASKSSIRRSSGGVVGHIVEADLS